jgi:hypothetical protein
VQNLAKSRLRNWTVIPHSTRAAENSRGTYVRCELKLTHNVSAQPHTLVHPANADGQCLVSHYPHESVSFLYQSPALKIADAEMSRCRIG